MSVAGEEGGGRRGGGGAGCNSTTEQITKLRIKIKISPLNNKILYCVAKISKTGVTEKISSNDNSHPGLEMLQLL